MFYAELQDHPAKGSLRFLQELEGAGTGKWLVWPAVPSPLRAASGAGTGARRKSGVKGYFEPLLHAAQLQLCPPKKRASSKTSELLARGISPFASQL